MSETSSSHLFKITIYFLKKKLPREQKPLIPQISSVADALSAEYNLLFRMLLFRVNFRKLGGWILAFYLWVWDIDQLQALLTFKPESSCPITGGYTLRSYLGYEYAQMGRKWL